MSKKICAILILFVLSMTIFAAPISFYGGKTSVSLEDGNKMVSLTGGAGVTSESIELTSDQIVIYGEDYRFVRCTGNVRVLDTEREISLSSQNVWYDREEKIMLSDGWIELEDKKNEARISGARVEYNENSSLITIQMKATIEQDTDKGLLKCSSDIIEYNADAQILSLKGNAVVTWGDDSYSASEITVDIETEEIELKGSITGEING